MTKKEIVKQISEELQLTQLKTKLIVQLTFDKIIKTLKEEGRIELRNFGVFEVKRRKPRRARNPRTNEPVEVEAKNVVTFQPGKIMEEEVRTMPVAAEPKRKPRKSTRPAPVDDGDGEPAVPVGAGTNRNGTAAAGHHGGDAADLPLKPR